MKMRQREILNKINADFARDKEAQDAYIARKIDLIKSSIKEYLAYSSAKGYVLSLTGGIDSFVCAALTADALKGMGAALHILLLPTDIEGNAHSLQACAEALLAQFDNLTFETLSLQPAFDTVENDFKKSMYAVQLDKYGIADTLARLRMVYKYALSRGFLVVGTIHAAEKIVGQFSKYGDTAADFEPIIDLVKMDIYDIARVYHAPDCVLEQRPGAGFELSEYEDAGEYVTYPDLSLYLAGHLLEKEKMQRIVSLYDKTVYKRNFPASPVNTWWKRQTQDTTLILVDMIHAFVDGSMPCADAQKAVEFAVEYIDAHPHMRVLYVRDAHPFDHCSFTENGGAFPVHAVAGTPDDAFTPEFYTIQKTINSPLERYNVFNKGMDRFKEEFSGFSAINENYGALKYNLTYNVVVGGIATEFCVLHTVENLVKNGFHVTVLKDALAYINKDDHAAALQKMADMGVVIV